jgi:hypothetical protein
VVVVRISGAWRGVESVAASGVVRGDVHQGAGVGGGEDFTITGKGVVAGKRHPKIDVQIKSWSNPAGKGVDWGYPMRVEHFNELAGEDYSLPRFLIVVIVPK